MAERQIGHRKSCLVLSARFPVVNWRSRPVVKSAYLINSSGKKKVNSKSHIYSKKLGKPASPLFPPFVEFPFCGKLSNKGSVIPEQSSRSCLQEPWIPYLCLDVSKRPITYLRYVMVQPYWCQNRRPEFADHKIAYSQQRQDELLQHAILALSAMVCFYQAHLV